MSDLNRRSFIKTTGIAGGGVLIASFASVPPGVLAQTDDADLVSNYDLNAFIKVDSSGKITIYSANPEMGQGIKTALPMIIAEEMGAAWEDVTVLDAPIDETSFGRQSAGGSTTIPRTWEQMRKMGASAREMFLSAGALVMEVSKDELEASRSRVAHTSGRSMTFGQLASLASRQAPPPEDELMFKSRESYTIIGTSVSGVDNLSITTGLALYGIDTNRRDMLYAAYQKCPTIGGKVVRANLEEVKKMPGMIDAFLLSGNDNPRELMDGVALVGENTWAVFQAKQALDVEWDTSRASKDSWTAMVNRAQSLHGSRGDTETIDKGDVEDVFEDADNTTLEALYEFPFVSHFCLEPMNCTADYRKGSDGEKDSLEMWVPTQRASRQLEMCQRLYGLGEDEVTIHVTRLGGSFGRRTSNEYVCEAIEISKRMNAPVKLTWSREDSVRHDFFRSGGFQSIKGAVDNEGKLVAFENHFMGMETDGRPVSGARFRDTEFPVQNISDAYLSQTMFDIDTPCGPWRAPGSNTNAFVVQSFLNELAHAGGRDYVEFLLEILGEPRWFEPGNIRSLNTGRAADVISLAAEKSGWGRSLPAGTGLGMAFYFCHAAHIAEVAEVTVDADRNLHIDNVTVAVDVGPIINMSGATSQVEGSVIDGISTMMTQKITMEEGQIQQSNFHDYEVMRIGQTPSVDIHFIQSENHPTGLGEPALPPVAPAVANAIFSATGHRIRKMPFAEEGYTLV